MRLGGKADKRNLLDIFFTRIMGAGSWQDTFPFRFCAYVTKSCWIHRYWLIPVSVCLDAICFNIFSVLL